MSQRSNLKKILPASGLIGLGLLAAGGLILLLESSMKTNDEVKKTKKMNKDDNKNNNENKENENNVIHIEEELKIYLKSLLSSQNESYIHNNNYQNDNEFSKLLPFTIFSMDISPNLLCIVLSYLPIESVLTIQKIDEKFCILANHILNDRKYLRSCARRGFYNRSIIWPYIAAQSIEGYNNLYIEKLNQWTQIETNESVRNEFKSKNTSYNALMKDIHRTFSNNRFLNLTKQQQHQLQKLLGVYSLLDPEVGYVQGMNFIAGTIILVIGDELDAFSIFFQLMKRNIPELHHENASTININNNIKRSNDHRYCGGGRSSKTQQCGYGLRDMFTDRLPGCSIALLEFEHLFQIHLPILYNHMKCEDIIIQSFASEWFMTLYAYVLPLSVTFRVYDLFLVDGWKLLHRIGLAILSRAQNTLLTSAADEMILYLKQFPDSGIFISSDDEEEGDSFIEHAFSFKITNYELHNFAVDLLNKATSSDVKI